MNSPKSRRVLTVREARTLILQRGGLAGAIAASLFDTHVMATGAKEVTSLTVPDNWPDEPIVLSTQGNTYVLRRQPIGIGAGREVRSFVERLNPEGGLIDSTAWPDGVQFPPPPPLNPHPDS